MIGPYGRSCRLANLDEMAERVDELQSAFALFSLSPHWLSMEPVIQMMNEIPNLANPRITSGPGPAPLRSITARRVDPAFEVRLQDLQWFLSGHSTVQLGSRCSFAFVLPAEFSERSVKYTVPDQRGRRRMVGRLNFVAPQSALDLHWSPGRVRSVVCMFDPTRLGSWGGLAGNWRDIDPLAAMDIRNQRLESTMGWL